MLLSGIFKIHDTHGLPLEDIMRELKKEDSHVDVQSWIRDSLKAGWEYQKAKQYFLHSFYSIYGKEKWVKHAFVNTYLRVLNEDKGA